MSRSDCRAGCACRSAALPRRGRQAQPALLLAAPTLLLILLAGCSGPDSGITLTPLPELDLTGAESAVREQIDDQRKALEELLAEPGAAPQTTAQAYADLGLLYVTYEFLEPAEVCFANARQLAPDDYRWAYLLGYLKMIQGVLPEAIPLYRRTLDLEPDFLPALLRLGRSELDSGRPEAARPWFDRALELEPNAAAAHEGLGKVASAGGDPAAAIGHFERALELEPTADSLHYALAQAHRGLGDLDRARFHLGESGDVSTRVVDPLINPLANLAESVQFYLMQGAEAMDDRDYEGAAAAFEAALERDDEDFAAYRGLAISYERLGDVALAAATLENALEKATTGDAGRDTGERASVLRSLGALAALSGRANETLERYLQALALAPEEPDLLLRAANALARQRRFDEAVEHYSRLIELEPQWAPAILEKRATALVNLGRHDEAVADFTRAVEAEPDDQRLRQRFAAALELIGRDKEAADQKAAAARLSGGGTRVASLVEAANRLTRQGDYEAAVTRFREALELQPGHLEARYALAGVLGHIRRFNEAVIEFESVISAAPRHRDARGGQIVALILAGRHGEARVKLQEALRAFPRHAGFALMQVRLLSTSPDYAVRDGDLAVAIATRVYAERQDAASRQALAFAYAEAGSFEEAVQYQSELVAEAEGAGDRAVADIRRSRLEAFERGEAWTSTSPDEIIASLGGSSR